MSRLPVVQCLIDKDQLLGPVTLCQHIKLPLDLQTVPPTVELCHPANRWQL